MKDLNEILALACRIGWEAGDMLQSYYHQTADERNLNVQYKQSEPVTAADLAVSQLILDSLQAALGEGDYGYVNEETYKVAEPQPLEAKWVWIIDPLDGTRDFIEKTGEYAVHIALTKSRRPVLSVVAVPEAKKLYYATLGGGAFAETRDGVGAKHSVTLQVSARDRVEDLIVVASRNHRDRRFEYLLKNLPCQQQKAVGSIGCKIAAIVEQQADIYLSLSNTSAPKDWDLAAPELILTEAGGKFTHFDGTPLQYNTGDVSQWGGLLGSNGHCHDDLRAAAESILAQWK